MESLNTHVIQVVEETGPIDYAEDGDDGDLDANLDEDDMTYPGDPLYLSDYEEGEYPVSTYCMHAYILTVLGS